LRAELRGICFEEHDSF